MQAHLIDNRYIESGIEYGKRILGGRSLLVPELGKVFFESTLGTGRKEYLAETGQACVRRAEESLREGNVGPVNVPGELLDYPYGYTTVRRREICAVSVDEGEVQAAKTEVDISKLFALFPAANLDHLIAAAPFP